jgi:hypothetical protein
MDTVSNFSVDVATFFFLAMFVCHLFNRNNHWNISDKIVLAEYEDSSMQQQMNNQVSPPPVPKAKKRKKKPSTKPKSSSKKANMQAARKPSATPTKPAVERNQNGYTSLQQDCFDALKSLGIKAVRERKFIVSTVFNEHDPSTVQDFLKVALSRSC